MIPLTVEELKIIIQCRDLLARKGINTMVTALDLTLRFCVLDAGDTGTTLSEETDK